MRTKQVSQVECVLFCHCIDSPPQVSQVPIQYFSRQPQALPDPWLEERMRQAQEREDERCCILSELQARALQLGIQAVLLDDDDALESPDPTPESDLEFPMTSDKWHTTWRIQLLDDWIMENYIED